MTYRRGDLLTGVGPGQACFHLAPNRGWDDRHNPKLGQDSSFRYIAEGFFGAGESLAQSCLHNEGKIDFKFYPLLYLYRHGAELALKQFLRWRAALSREQLRDGKPTGHGIVELWEMLRPEAGTSTVMFDEILQNRLADPDATFAAPYSVADVDALLRDIDDLDEESFAFRYPKTKRGEVLLPQVNAVGVRTATDTLVPLGTTLVAWMVAMERAIEEDPINQRARREGK